MNLYSIQAGNFKLDGGAMFGVVPKSMWEKTNPADSDNMIDMSARCMLIEEGDKLILVDTGMGNKQSEKFFSHYKRWGNFDLVKSINAAGFGVDEITDVLLTHLHFDHSGGCTKLNRTGAAVPIFPRARHLVQKDCWSEAISPNERYEDVFHSEDFLPLQEKGLIELVDGDTEIVPGVTLKVADGPSKGHQMVMVNMGSERIVFAGDLIPTAYHLQANFIAAADEFPNETLVQKKELLDMAMKEGWIIVFGHGQENRSGYVEEWNGRPHLLPKEI